jgi:hypothetical protein
MQRHLRFSNLETGKPVCASCSECGKIFTAEPKGKDRTDDLLLRIRAEFEAHSCNEG